MNLTLPISWLLVAALLLAMLSFWLASYLMDRKLKKVVDAQTDSTLFVSQFRCVKINPCENHCRRVSEYQKPILLSASPRLPVYGCDAKKCGCTFIQLEDRRSGVDRRSGESPQKKSAYSNKRTLKDRRRPLVAYLRPRRRVAA